MSASFRTTVLVAGLGLALSACGTDAAQPDVRRTVVSSETGGDATGEGDATAAKKPPKKAPGNANPAANPDAPATPPAPAAPQPTKLLWDGKSFLGSAELSLFPIEG